MNYRIATKDDYKEIINMKNRGTKAINLYNKFGFKKEGEKKFPYAYLSIYGLYF